MTGFQVPPGVGEEDAPFNTVEWAKSVRTSLLSQSCSLPRVASNVADYLSMLRETRGWEQLNKPDGTTFASLEEFCAHRRPWGLGMKLADLERWTSSNGPAAAPLYWNPENGENNTEQPEAWPEADLFPMLDDEALAKLAADIKANGLREPIVLWKGRVLDGRNRLKACALADVPPTFTALASCPSPAAYVVSANLHRRHLTESQRAMLGARLLPMFEKDAKDRQRAAAAQTNAALGRGETLPPNLAEASGESTDKAATAVRVGRGSVKSAAKVLASPVTELAAAVDRGEATVSAAAEIATLPADEQREVVAGGKKAIQAKAKAIREAKPKRPAKAKPAPEEAPAPAAKADTFNGDATAQLSFAYGEIGREQQDILPDEATDALAAARAYIEALRAIKARRVGGTK